MSTDGKLNRSEFRQIQDNYTRIRPANLWPIMLRWLAWPLTNKPISLQRHSAYREVKTIGKWKDTVWYETGKHALTHVSCLSLDALDKFKQPVLREIRASMFNSEAQGTEQDSNIWCLFHATFEINRLLSQKRNIMKNKDYKVPVLGLQADMSAG